MVGLLSQHCLLPSCSYFITEPLQQLPNNSYSVTYGYIYTGSSPLDEKAHCLSFPREHGSDTTISEIQINVHGLEETKTFSTNFPDNLILDYGIVSGDHY